MRTRKLLASVFYRSRIPHLEDNRGYVEIIMIRGHDDIEIARNASVPVKVLRFRVSKTGHVIKLSLTKVLIPAQEIGPQISRKDYKKIVEKLRPLALFIA